jgi:peptide/nickel transport system substrate-binding protein
MVRAPGLLGILLCGALLLGCQPGKDDTIVFSVSTAPRVLDPRLAADAASERVNDLLFSSLVELDERGIARPGMATWESVDPLTYRLMLRDDRAPFVDGSLPSAADVVATYRAVLDPSTGSPHLSALKHVASVEVVDAQTIEFGLQRVDPRLPSRLTLGILPRELAETSQPVDRPIGSGTFEFIARDSRGSVLLERRRDGQRVRFAPTADPTMRVLQLIRGEAHLVQNDLPSELYGYLAGRDEVDLLQAPGITFAYLGFNLDDPVLGQRPIREAIAHAIDREAIMQYLFQDRAMPAASVLRPDHWAGVPGLEGFRYDPERARRLLAQAGFGSGRPLQLSYKTSTDPFRLRIANVFQQQLADVGIELSIQSYDWGTFFGDIKAGRFQLYSLAWVGVNTPDILRYAFHSESLPPNGANRGRYLSSRVDELIEQAERLPAAEAAPLYRQAQQIIRDDLVYVPLWYESNIAALRGLDGFEPRFDGSYLALEDAERIHDSR